jgi:hypothetical protein
METYLLFNRSNGGLMFRDYAGAKKGAKVMSVHQMWFLLTLGFQALKYQGKQSFSRVHEAVICVSFLYLFRSG